MLYAVNDRLESWGSVKFSQDMQTRDPLGLDRLGFIHA
jgi:hypothetical protein